MINLGIDISKKQLDVALLKDDRSYNKTFTNSLKGFNELDAWVKGYSSDSVSACMEATGFYGELLAEFLYSKAYRVSIVNPFCIKAYAQSKLTRHKTDKKDSLIIAKYALTEKPKLWKPMDSNFKELRELFRCLQSLKIQLNEVTNHLENPSLSIKVIKIWQELKQNILQQIKDIEAELIDLISNNDCLYQDYINLQTIPGVSKTTAIAVLAEIPNYSSFKNARQLAAFAGLTPKQRTSGSSVRGKTKLSKIGSPILRKALYFPSIVAKKYNPIIKDFCTSLSNKGKHKMAIIGAAMRKLLHIIYGVLKNKVPFDAGLIKNI
jgi:transposase